MPGQSRFQTWSLMAVALMGPNRQQQLSPALVPPSVALAVADWPLHRKEGAVVAEDRMPGAAWDLLALRGW